MGDTPKYFAQESTGYEPGQEAEKAAGDVSAILRYADTVNGAIWDMLMVAEKKHPELPEPEHYFGEARSLCFLLIDLVDETERRVKVLFEEIEQLLGRVPDRPAPARKEG